MLYDTIQSGQPVELIDVRTPAEFCEVHVSCARNVPLDRLDPAKFLADKHRNGSPLFIICQSGGRGEQACRKLHRAGLTNVINVEGGTQAWVESGLPVIRGKKSVSLERQVRMAAGSLVLLGVLLGWFIHPAFFVLSAFVGAGLMFSGITDSCLMGMMLARMPWNRRGQDSACTAGSKTNEVPCSKEF